jgi:hypothetical protein
MSNSISEKPLSFLFFIIISVSLLGENLQISFVLPGGVHLPSVHAGCQKFMSG